MVARLLCDWTTTAHWVLFPTSTEWYRIAKRLTLLMRSALVVLVHLVLSPLAFLVAVKECSYLLNFQRLSDWRTREMTLLICTLYLPQATMVRAQSLQW